MDILQSNQPYRKLNNINALVHWDQSQYEMGEDLDSRLFTQAEMNICREGFDMEDDSQPDTTINKPDKVKPIKWVQWEKEFSNYVAQYKTARQARVSLSYVISNESKQPNATVMAQYPLTEQEFWNLTLKNRNRWYTEDSKQVYALLEELMLGAYGYEWLGENAMRNRNGTQAF